MSSIPGLDRIKAHCDFLIKSAENFETKLKTKSRVLIEENPLLVGRPSTPDQFRDEFKRLSKIQSFLLYIGSFEKEFFELIRKTIGKINGGMQHGNFNLLIKNNSEHLLRKDSDFYSFSSIKDFLAPEDRIYVAELIALRNYFSHGMKSESDLKYRNNDLAKEALVNDLDLIHAKLTRILVKLKEQEKSK